jgi:negative regulator of sigma E activity
MFWASQNSTQELNISALKSLQSILSQYDITNLSTDQEASLLTQLQSLTQPQDTGKENSFWTNKNNNQGLNTSALESLKSILSQYDFTNLSTNQEKNLFTQLKSAGLLQAGSFLNFGA